MCNRFLFLTNTCSSGVSWWCCINGWFWFFFSSRISNSNTFVHASTNKLKFFLRRHIARLHQLSKSRLRTKIIMITYFFNNFVFLYHKLVVLEFLDLFVMLSWNSKSLLIILRFCHSFNESPLLRLQNKSECLRFFLSYRFIILEMISQPLVPVNRSSDQSIHPFSEILI